MTVRKRRTGDAKMSSLGELLDPTLQRMGVRAAVRDAQAAEVFSDVVGLALAPHCRALRIERKVLVIACANPALAHQLHLEAPRILEGINERLGAEVVNRMRFTTA